MEMSLSMDILRKNGYSNKNLKFLLKFYRVSKQSITNFITKIIYFLIKYESYIAWYNSKTK